MQIATLPTYESLKMITTIFTFWSLVSLNFKFKLHVTEVQETILDLAKFLMLFLSK